MCCLKLLFLEQRNESTARELITENEIDSLANTTMLNHQQIVEFKHQLLKDYPKGFLTRKDFCHLFENQLINDQDDERRARKLKKFAGHVFK